MHDPDSESPSPHDIHDHAAISGLITEVPEREVPHPAGPPALLLQPTRAALQRLLGAGVILKRTHEIEYIQIVKDADAVNHVLAELGLKMILREGYGMAALVRQGDAGAEDDPEDSAEEVEEDGDSNRALLRVTRLKVLHSLILMALRGYHRERERAQDQRIIIELETLKDRIKPFWPLVNSEMRSDRSFHGAIRLLEKHGILNTVRDDKNAREISPVITLALNAERFQILEAEFKRHLELLHAAQQEN